VVQAADKARASFDRFGLALPTAAAVGYAIHRHSRRALPYMVKGGVATVAVAGVLYMVKKHYDEEQPAQDATEFLCSEWDERLAEECLADVPLDNTTLQSGGVISCPGALVWEDVSGALMEGTTEADVGSVTDVDIGSEAVVDAVTSLDAGIDLDTPPEESLGRVVNATKPLETRNSRALLTYKDRMTYSRRVFDACKVKFGTPKNTEANFKAVWRYAGTMMKDHGLRPSHQAKVLPMIVTKVFVPTLDELVAQKQVGAYQMMINGRFDETLSTWDKWVRKCRRAIGCE